MLPYRATSVLAVAAIAMDPLTAAVLSLKDIRNMTIEMFEGERQYLSHFGGKRPRRVPAISVPANTVGVDVPLDPALAVVHRFGKLMQNK